MTASLESISGWYDRKVAAQQRLAADRRKIQLSLKPVYSANAEGRVEVFEEYAAGLKDIEAFSHLYLLYLFDRAGVIELVRPTFLDDKPHGIYASRHPCRQTESACLLFDCCAGRAISWLSMASMFLTIRLCWILSHTYRSLTLLVPHPTGG